MENIIFVNITSFHSGSSFIYLLLQLQLYTLSSVHRSQVSHHFVSLYIQWKTDVLATVRSGFMLGFTFHCNFSCLTSRAMSQLVMTVI